MELQESLTKDGGAGAISKCAGHQTHHTLARKFGRRGGRTSKDVANNIPVVFIPEEVKKMDHLRAALTEAPRLYPSFPVDRKEVSWSVIEAEIHDTIPDNLSLLSDPLTRRISRNDSRSERTLSAMTSTLSHRHYLPLIHTLPSQQSGQPSCGEMNMGGGHG